MGAFGFAALRRKVAELTNEEIYKHYCNLFTYHPTIKDSKDYYKQYDAKTDTLDKKYDYKYNDILYFLYASDISAKMPVDVCKKIWELIKDYDDDVLYGYSGRPDCAKFADFKEIVKDCMDNNCNMRWY